MRTIIHDLDKNNISKFKFDNDDKIYNALDCYNNCIGCFSCWIKHPMKCIYNDNYSNIVKDIGASDKFIIISKNKYGCYSEEVKKVLERCISYVLPYFTIRNKMIHHKKRFNKELEFEVYFYGNIDDDDKKCLYNLVKANSINLGVRSFKVKYLSNWEEIDYVHLT